MKFNLCIKPVAIVFIFAICMLVNKAASARTVSVYATSTPKQITLVNLSKERIGFYYYTKFFESVEFYTEPGKSTTIALENPLWLMQLCVFHSRYFIDLDNDTFFMNVNAKGIATIIPNHAVDSERVNELGAFPFIMSHVKLNSNEVFLRILRSHSWKDADSIIYDRFLECACLFVEYKNSHNLSRPFERLVESEMRLEYYSYQFAQVGDREKWKFKLSASYQNHLDSIATVLLNGSGTDGMGSPWYANDCRFFLYRMKRRFGRPIGADSLYKFALTEIADNSLRNKILFFIVKNGLTSGDNAAVGLAKDFSTDCTDSGYSQALTVLVSDKILNESARGRDQLITADKTAKTLIALIAADKNKLIYIDVWASWCAPCRRELQSSALVRARYKNAPIDFVFISQDEAYSAWTAACKAEHLFNSSSSYLLPNFQTSGFKHQFKINNIPHYILIGRKGKVINGDAPRPSDSALIALLDRSLKQ